MSLSTCNTNSLYYHSVLYIMPTVILCNTYFFLRLIIKYYLEWCFFLSSNFNVSGLLVDVQVFSLYNYWKVECFIWWLLCFSSLFAMLWRLVLCVSYCLGVVDLCTRKEDMGACCHNRLDGAQVIQCTVDIYCSNRQKRIAESV